MTLSERLRESIDAHKEAAKEMAIGNGNVDVVVATRLAVIDGLKEIEQLERDAELGSLVRQLEKGSRLERCFDKSPLWFVNDRAQPDSCLCFGDTPEEALRKAIGEK